MVFGGNGSTLFSRIVAYNPSTDEWTTEGNLLTPRERPGVITVGDEFLIIGGDMNSSDEQSSEKCKYHSDLMECAYQNPTEPFGTKFTN